MKARIIGVQTQFNSFKFYFHVQLAFLLLQHSDNLSKTLQSPHMTAAEGQRLASRTIATLSKCRLDEAYDLFWKKVEHSRQSLDIEELTLPRRRKLPKKLEEGSEGILFQNPKDYYQKSYFEAIDFIISSIQERFNQPGYRMYNNIESLIIATIKGDTAEEFFAAVTEFYSNDFDIDQLRPHLQVLATNYPQEQREEVTVKDVCVYFQKMSTFELLSQAVVLLKLLIVMPATNTISERSFSALKRLKNYMRSTTSQERLNHLLALHTHKDYIDSLELIAVANEFVSFSENRIQIFGNVTEDDNISGGSVANVRTVCNAVSTVSNYSSCECL